MKQEGFCQRWAEPQGFARPCIQCSYGILQTSQWPACRNAVVAFAKVQTRRDTSTVKASIEWRKGKPRQWTHSLSSPVADCEGHTDPSQPRKLGRDKGEHEC